MIKTYKIVPGNNGKQNVQYKHDGSVYTIALYTGDSDIFPGYVNEDRIKWAEMLNDLLGSGAILTKMRTATNMGTFFTLVIAVIQSGANGFPDEQGLQTLLGLSGWGFTDPQKTTINNYLENNNFSFSI